MARAGLGAAQRRSGREVGETNKTGGAALEVAREKWGDEVELIIIGNVKSVYAAVLRRGQRS